MRISRILAVGVAVAIVLAACSDGGSDDSTTASVSIASPVEGATVTSPVNIEMQADGLAIEPAGTIAEGSGHFHLMIDAPCVEPGQVIPANDAHLHFGDASTQATLDLAPGEYTLCLQAGDGIHTALDLTDTVTFTVR